MTIVGAASGGDDHVARVFKSRDDDTAHVHPASTRPRAHGPDGPANEAKLLDN